MIINPSSPRQRLQWAKISRSLKTVVQCGPPPGSIVARMPCKPMVALLAQNVQIRVRRTPPCHSSIERAASLSSEVRSEYEPD
jgi:hypothetical protein